MSNEKITAEELMNLFNTAQIKLVFEDLLAKGTKLHTIRTDLLDSLAKYGVSPDRFQELFTIHLGDEAKKYTFEHNCAAVFVNDILIKEEFYQKGKDFINNLVDGTQSAEGFKKFALSPEQIYNGAQRSGMPTSKVREQMQKHLEDINSPIWDTYREQLKELPSSFSFIRGDFDRGVLEYCQDGDMDYAFSAIKENLEDEEPGIYKNLADAYSDMEKDEVSDELIELILKLQPTIYSCAPSLISLHSNPEKAKQIYDEAWNAREKTEPKIKKMSKDLFGVSLFPSSSASSAQSPTASSSEGEGCGWFIGTGLCFVLAAGNSGMEQTGAATVFLVIGIALAIVGIIRKIIK